MAQPIQYQLELNDFMNPKISVILPAAGRSSRFGGGEKKPFTQLEGRAVWLRTAELFVSRNDVIELILVISKQDEELVRMRYQANLAFFNAKLVIGGEERVDSVRAALDQINPNSNLVLIHDAVRPCVDPGLIDSVINKAAETGAAILATEVVQTVKKSGSNGVVSETIPRKGLWLAQTPQVFEKNILKAAYNRQFGEGKKPTDDSEVVEMAGHEVTIVPCPATNIKITTKDDLNLANLIIKSRPDTKKRSWHPFAEEQGW